MSSPTQGTAAVPTGPRLLVVTVVHRPDDARILHRQIALLRDEGYVITYPAPWRATGVEPPEAPEVSDGEGVAAVGALIAEGWSTRDAVTQVAGDLGLRRRALYAAVTAERSGDGQ